MLKNQPTRPIAGWLLNKWVSATPGGGGVEQNVTLGVQAGPVPPPSPEPRGAT